MYYIGFLLFFLYEFDVFIGEDGIEDVEDEDDEDEVIGDEGMLWFLLIKELEWMLVFLSFVEEGEVLK